MRKSTRKRGPQRRYNPARIQAARLRAGLTQQELADRTGISIASISRYENGIQPFSQESLENIAKALGCPVRELIPAAPGEPETAESLLAEMSDETRDAALAMLRALRDRDARR